MIIGISGASGALLGIELLATLQQLPEWETHLILSSGARRTILSETQYSVAEVEAMATHVHPIADIGASIASGSFRTAGMIIAPCSMKTLAGVANGFSENLLLRAADVMLKEQRRLVLAPRETPLSKIHLRNMMLAAEAGAILVPPVITCYQRPTSVQEMTRHIIGKMLDLFDIEMPGFQRWGEDIKE
ncbi:UbiX family flavin prenyltransferase [Telmatobacter bradus]|uniref:UbiX family flavin prenyltransferase n=1 Tax=Telmatobacter bradus TaxID=474953 RepID=UPI003B427C8F